MTTEAPPRSRWANLPNWLTAARFVMALALFVFIALELWPLCLPMFVLAAVTDWADGYLARRYGWTSALGRNMDPLADKVLVCGAFIFLLEPGVKGGWLAPWVVVVVVMREMVITTLRSYLEGQGVKFGADWLGKLKMWLQCAALVVIFLVLQVPTHWTETRAWMEPLRNGLIYAMAGATVLSGLQYLWKAYRIISHPSPSA